MSAARNGVPVSAAATASPMRPTSPAASAIAQAVTAPTTSGNSSRTRSFRRRPIAASGLPIAAQYTVRKRRCSLWLPAAAASMNSFAPSGSASGHNMFAARRKATLAHLSASVNSFVGMCASTASDSWPRPSQDRRCAQRRSASAAPPARIAAAARRSASAQIGQPHRALRRPVTSRSGSGSRSESRVSAARRTTTGCRRRDRQPPSSAATQSAQPTQPSSRPRVTRRTSP